LLVADAEPGDSARVGRIAAHSVQNVRLSLEVS
jgi:hypothetical protein